MSVTWNKREQLLTEIHQYPKHLFIINTGIKTILKLFWCYSSQHPHPHCFELTQLWLLIIPATLNSSRSLRTMDKACHFCSSVLRLYCSQRQRFPLPSDTPLPCFCLENLNSILNTSGSCLNDSALRRERKIVLHFSCYLKT